MENCIFCKIIKGEIPCYKVYENDMVLAFLDINPVNEGHVLVIPKKHHRDIFEIEEEYLCEVVKTAKKISLKMREYGIDGVNIFQANTEAGEQTVFHYHMHVIPRKKDDGINFSREMLRHLKKMDPDQFESMRKALEI
ncbi:MAG: HIT family protein [Candidatus Pacebacteria bacterium]|nr:HIT family protein [Candidatus Paceibacterota bacterium]